MPRAKEQQQISWLSISEASAVMMYRLTVIWQDTGYMWPLEKTLLVEGVQVLDRRSTNLTLSHKQ